MNQQEIRTGYHINVLLSRSEVGAIFRYISLSGLGKILNINPSKLKDSGSKYCKKQEFSKRVLNISAFIKFGTY